MTTPSRVLETAVDWLERAVPVVKAARVGFVDGVDCKTGIDNL